MNLLITVSSKISNKSTISSEIGLALSSSCSCDNINGGLVGNSGSSNSTNSNPSDNLGVVCGINSLSSVCINCGIGKGGGNCIGSNSVCDCNVN